MIEKFDYYFPFKQVTKRIHLYLPENYHETNEHYPVMYMYDGHNLFFDEEATYGTSWGLKDFLEDYDKSMIIVGIECSHEGNERLNEYSPYTFETGFFGSISGYGKKLMDWLVTDLKPYIDTTYRTYPFREATAIGGSSMGGLMAFYSIVTYNQYFSKAACLSPSISFCMQQLKEEWQQAKFHTDTRVFFSFGENEIRNYPSVLQDVIYFNDEIVKSGGISYLHLQSNGEHNEQTWQKQNQLYLDVLWK